MAVQNSARDLAGCVAVARSRRSSGHVVPAEQKLAAWDGVEVVRDLEPHEVMVPIYLQAEQMVGKARSALDAEVAAAEFVGLVSTMIAGSVADEEVELAFVGFIGQLVEMAQDRATPAALALLRALSVVLPRPIAEVADGAAAVLRAAAVRDRPWVARLGAPELLRCWRYADVAGDQEALYLVFGYGRREHFIGVLVDHQLGGGIKDCYVGDDPALAWRDTSRLAAEQDEAVVEAVTGEQARARLAAAVANVPCPMDEDQRLDLAAFSGLLRSRMNLLDGRRPALSALAPAGRSRREPEPEGLLW